MFAAAENIDNIDRFFDFGLSVDLEFLRQNVDDLFARRKHQFIHIGYQLLDIKTGNFIVIPFGQDAPMLNTMPLAMAGSATAKHSSRRVSSVKGCDTGNIFSHILE